MHKKIVLSLFLILVFLFSFVPVYASVPEDTQEETLAVAKRVYSIVYDDSGSMYHEGSTNWARANYAFQIMASFMNDRDEVYVTRMSAPQYSVPLDYFSYDRQVAVDYFRDTYRNGDTPMESIKTAADQLVAVEDTDPSTIYWLVIITDGSFKYNGEYINSVERFREYLNLYTDVNLANHSDIHVAYLAIDDQSIKLYPELQNNLFTFDGKDEKIVDSMIDITTLITGKYHFDQGLITIRDDSPNVLEFDLTMDIFDMTLLFQGSENLLLQGYYLGDEAEQLLLKEQQINVHYPEAPSEEIQTDTSLLGHVTTVKNNGVVLKKGKYRFYFEKSLLADKIDIFGSLALELQLVCSDQDGNRIESFDAVDDRSVINLKANLFSYNTDIPVDLSVFGETVQYSLTYAVDDELIAETQQADMSLSGQQLYAKETSAMAKVRIGDYYLVDAGITGTPVNARAYTLVANGTTGELLARDELLGNQTAGVLFEVYDRGKRVTDPQDIGNMQLKFQVANNIPFLNTSWEVTDEGTILCYPTFSRDPFPGKYLNWLTTWLAGSDEIQIRGSVQSAAGEISDAYTNMRIIDEPPLTKWMHRIAPVAVCLLLIGYSFKPRFWKKDVIEWVYLNKESAGLLSGIHRETVAPLQQKTTLREFLLSWIPFVSNKRMIEGICLYPAGIFTRHTGGVYIKLREIIPAMQWVDIARTDIFRAGGIEITERSKGIYPMVHGSRFYLAPDQGMLIHMGEHTLLIIYKRRQPGGGSFV